MKSARKDGALKQASSETYNSGVKNRRARALVRAEAQLKSGVKNTRDGVVSLTESDVKRIEKEITVLKSKI